ncbi:MAG: radical SAM protein [Candidatus Hydrogenedentota bacterium]
MLKLLPHVFQSRKVARVPVYLIHFVTSRCNAKCPHCFIFAENDPRFDKNQMTLEEIDLMTRSIGKDLYNVSLTGGEIFLRKDMKEICECYLKNTGVQVIQLFTNGFFEERTVECLDYLSRTYPDRNFVMLTSIDDLHDAHNSYRKLSDGFNKALRTYERVRDLGRANIDLDIGLTVSHANEGHLDKIYDFLVRERKYRTLSCTLVRGNPLDPAMKTVDLNNYRLFSDRIASGMKTGELDCFKGFIGAGFLNAKSVIMRKLIPRTVEEGFQSNCYAGRLIGVTYSNGDVYPCEILEKPIGNLRDYGFSMPDLWASDKAGEIRDWIWDTKCHCTHECFMTMNILFNPVYYPKLLWEYSKIKINIA